MVWRIWGYFPDWRTFSEKGSDNIDLLLAVITTIIQIPIIKHSSLYSWLTIFQLLRFYRVILAVPTMRPLLVSSHVMGTSIWMDQLNPVHSFASSAISMDYST